MKTTTIVTGALLFLLGPLAYVLSQSQSKTAFIPSVFGLILLVCGFISTTPAKTKMALHIAVVVAFLAMLGSLFGRGGFAIPGWVDALSGRGSGSAAPFTQMLLFLLCGFFVVRSVMWFLGNRASRGAA